MLPLAMLVMLAPADCVYNCAYIISILTLHHTMLLNLFLLISICAFIHHQLSRSHINSSEKCACKTKALF